MSGFFKLTVLLSLFMATFVFGQIPQTMSYQGVLTNANSNPVNGLVSLTFKLYDAATGGTNPWEETQSVDVMNGIFNVILGSQTPLNLPFDKPYWLGISVGNDAELAPRIELTAAPYSLNSNTSFIQPAQGQSITIKNQAGEITHIFSPTGDELTGQSTFNKVAGRTGPVSVTKGKIYAFDLCIVIPDPSEQSGLFPWSRFDSTGLKVRGSVMADNFSIVNGLGDTLTIFRKDGTSFHKGQETYAGGIKLQGSKGIIFADGTEQTTAGSGESNAFNGTLFNKPLIMVNAAGDTVFRVDTDGNSVHKGEEVFLNGIKMTDDKGGPGMFIGQRSILTFNDQGDGVNFLGPSGAIFLKKVSLRDTLEIKDANGNVTTQFLPDGTSLHKGDETFEGDVILKGTGGKGIKLVDANGETLAGFGREDLETGQRFGVFGKAENPGDLAGLFEGPVDVLGEITASSLHIVNTNGDSLTDFFADGTSRHRGLETYEAGIEIVNSDGSTAIDLQPNTDPITGYALTVVGNVEVLGVLFAQAKLFKIDHPLDPENKYLYHTSVESPDMKNVYDGVIMLDENGEAWVDLPEWFEALNKDFRYQLTCIGGFASVYIEEEIQNNRFKISGGRPDLKVSWQVTGIRDDAFARANRNPVESMK